MNRKKVFFMVIMMFLMIIFCWISYDYQVSAEYHEIRESNDVEKIYLENDNIKIYIGDFDIIIINGSESQAIYVSDNPSIATVDEKGIIKPKNIGKTKIFVKIGNEVLLCNVSVIGRPGPAMYEYEASDKMIKITWNECLWKADLVDDFIEPESYSVYLLDQDTQEYKLIDVVKNTYYEIDNLEPGTTYYFKIAGNLRFEEKIIEQALSEKIICKTLTKAIQGWKKEDGKIYYYEHGFKVTDIKKNIDGEYYIFDKNGTAIVSSFIEYEGVEFYTESDGKIARNKDIKDEKTGKIYRADQYGELSMIQSAPSGFEYTASDTTIKLKWDKCKWADSYSVYMYDQESQRLEFIDSTETVNFTIKNITPETVYYFKVAGNILNDDGELSEQELSKTIKCKTLKKALTLKGWQIINKQKYYYEEGKKVVGTKKKIEGETYFFDEDGVVQTSKLYKYGDYLYYLDSEGKIVRNQDITDEKTGIKYLAGNNGRLKLHLLLQEDIYSGENKKINLEDIQNVVMFYNGVDTFIFKESLKSLKESVVQCKKGIIYGISPGKGKIYAIFGGITINGKNEKTETFYDMPAIIDIKVNAHPAPNNIRCNNNVDKVEITWDKYEDAMSFSVYIYDKDIKEYKLLGKTTKNSYVVKNLKDDTKYSFKVAANIKVQGVLVEQALSKKVEAKTLKAVNGWITKNGKTYYYQKGYPVKAGLRKIDGKLYIFDKDYSLIQKAFTTIAGNLYYSESDGVVAKNKEVTDKATGEVYIADKKGVLIEKKEALYNNGITYIQLARTPDKYKGKRVKFKGKVVQVVDESKTIRLRVAVNNDYNQIIYCEFSSSLISYRILEDDQIVIYGKSRGIYTYRSILREKISIPSVSAEIIELKS